MLANKATRVDAAQVLKGIYRLYLTRRIVRLMMGAFEGEAPVDRRLHFPCPHPSMLTFPASLRACLYKSGRSPAVSCLECTCHDGTCPARLDRTCLAPSFSIHLHATSPSPWSPKSPKGHHQSTTENNMHHVSIAFSIHLQPSLSCAFSQTQSKEMGRGMRTRSPRSIQQWSLGMAERGIMVVCSGVASSQCHDRLPVKGVKVDSSAVIGSVLGTGP